MSRGNRLPFLLRDLEREIRGIAPQTGAVELHLPPGCFRPVMDELASHYGNPDIAKAEYFNVGGVGIKRVRSD